jgi:hypothetical protein
LNDEITPLETKRIEQHLLDCGSCRARLSKMRSGHRFAGQLPRFTPQRDGWRAIENALEADQSRDTSEPLVGAVLGIIARRSFAIAAIAIALVLFGALAALSLKSVSDARESRLYALEAIDFHRVSIANIEHNTEPHVVAEGYVSEVRIDHDDGDLVFKLVEDVQQAQPFIICEILNPEKLAPPPVGSRVRVYGVSRYDNQQNHNWYEVHPVLNIELVP